MNVKQISSVKNDLIKYVIELQTSSKARRQEQRFFVEGEKEIDFAIENGYELEYILYASTYANQIKNTWKNISKIFIECSKDVFEKLIYRESTIHFAAVFKNKIIQLNKISFKENAFFIVLDNVEKPGNIGAILRTADAVKANAVLICDDKADVYNPNVIRSSVGCVFNVPIVAEKKEVILDFLKENEINIFTTYLHESNWYYNEDYLQSCAIVLGSEAHGVDDFWIKNTKKRIKIPMLGNNDSLNVSNAAAVLAYEVIRQRKQ